MNQNENDEDHHFLEFEDLIKLDHRAIEVLVYHGVDFNDIVFALRQASGPLKELFFSSMAVGLANRIKNEIALMGPVPLDKIKRAQRKILHIVQQYEAYSKDNPEYC